jgi:hypothetical protein
LDFGFGSKFITDFGINLSAFTADFDGDSSEEDNGSFFITDVARDEIELQRLQNPQQ